eukprot:531813_1
MSTYALITILAYLILNIQNTNSMFAAPFSVTTNIPPEEWEVYKGDIATPGEAAHMFLETLIEHGLKPESEAPSAQPSSSPVPQPSQSPVPEPSTQPSRGPTEPSREPSAQPSRAPTEPPNYRRRLQNTEDLPTATVYVENNPFGITCSCTIIQPTLAELEAHLNGLYAQIGDAIPYIPAPAGGVDLLAGSAIILDVVSDYNIDAPPSNSTCELSTIAASFAISLEEFNSYSMGAATLSNAGTNMVQTLIESKVPSAASKVRFDSSKVSNN